MRNIIGVRFKKPGKIYFFDPKEYDIKKGESVIVETSMGEEFGEVVIPNRMMPEDKIVAPLKKVIRIATQKDKKHYEENKAKEEEALKVCRQKIEKHGLNMKLLECEFKFDNSKVLFYFTADGRIDFRELVKELASIYKTRIELRQIGVRDEIKRMGGNGVCGRELCCCSFLGNFETVSIKMAKEQNVSLNPSKISGNCGRLMCCLKYEQEAYEEKLKKLPKIGAIVKSEDGEGIVSGLEILKGIVSVKFQEQDEYFYKKYKAEDLKIIKDVESDEEIQIEDTEELRKLQELEKIYSEEETDQTEDDI